jgi:hypothetical protein
MRIRIIKDGMWYVAQEWSDLWDKWDTVFDTWALTKRGCKKLLNKALYKRNNPTGQKVKEEYEIK